MSYIGRATEKTNNRIQSRQVYYPSSGQTYFAVNYDIGYVDVFVNGTKLVNGDDYTANTGTSITLAQGTDQGDVVEIIGYGNFQVANFYNRKNLVINGNFDVWQRGTSFTTTSVYNADRWINFAGGTTSPTITVSRQAFTQGQADVPNNPRYYLRSVVTAGSGTTEVAQMNTRVENARLVSGKTVTMSFWAKADASKNIAVEFRRHYGYTGSPSTETTKISVTTCALTASWKKFVITTKFPSDADKTYSTAEDHFWGPIFWFTSGSSYNDRNNSLGSQSGTFDIAQVQIEYGDKATDFENRTFAEELKLCQRYYEKSYDVDVVPGTNTATGMTAHGSHVQTTTQVYGASVSLRVTKRTASPTITIYLQSGTSGQINVSYRGSITSGTAATWAVGQNSFAVFTSSVSGLTVGEGVSLAFHWTVDAEL